MCMGEEEEAPLAGGLGPAGAPFGVWIAVEAATLSDDEVV
jgi:hypothetical protein